MMGYPLDSHVTFDDNGVPMYDRAISSAPLRELIKRLFSDGVLPDVASNLQVQYVGSTRVAGTVSGDVDTYNVVVNPGFGICAGCLKLQENYYGLTMNTAITSQPRIDTVVLRLNDNDSVRSCDFHIVQGIPAANPVAPTLTRNPSIWEIGLANLYKPAAISNSNPVVVTDTRLNPERCGIISSISEFDTSTLFAQIQAAIVGYENEFDEWFRNLQTQLSGDVTANLQNQIDELNNAMDDIEDVVGGVVADSTLSADTTLFVSKSGDDITGDGSSFKPYLTIMKAVNSLPKNLNGKRAIINIAAGTYTETITIENFFGGVVTINGVVGAGVTITGLTIQNCAVLVDAISLTVGNGGIFVGAKGMFYSATSNITVSGAVDGVILRYSAVMEITTRLTINNASNRAIQVQYASTASIANLAGAGNAIGVYVYNSEVYLFNTTLSATTATINDNGILNIRGAG